jgi:hypothetical protein
MKDPREKIFDVGSSRKDLQIGILEKGCSLWIVEEGSSKLIAGAGPTVKDV